MKAVKTLATCSKEGGEAAIAQKACSCSPSLIAGSLTKKQEAPFRAMSYCEDMKKGKM